MNSKSETGNFNLVHTDCAISKMSLVSFLERELRVVFEFSRVNKNSFCFAKQ